MPVRSPLQDVEIPNMSLADFMLNCFTQHGDNTAITDVTLGNSITFCELQSLVLSCAGYLKGQGLKKGDMVAVCTRNCIEFLVGMLGVIACGGIVIPCNPSFKTGEFMRQFDACQPCIAFVSEEGLETIKIVASRLPNIKKIIGFCEFFQEISNEKYKKLYTKDINVFPENDVAIVLYSSGTTGYPKGILTTHKNLLGFIISFRKATQHHKHEHVYLDRPMYGVAGLKYTLLSLAIGMNTFISSIQHQGDRLLKEAQDHKINRLMGTPQTLLMLADNENYKKYDTSLLKQILVGGATIPPNILQKVALKYNINVLVHYAMTEVGTITTNNKSLSYENDVGIISPNIIAKIIPIERDSREEELPDGECGEIVVKGPLVAKGYLDNTDEAFDAGGWFHTGDIGYFDQEERLHITGRLREMIKYKTLQIFPTELENVLMKHPKIADVGVIGVPDLYCGEIPKAFVVKKNNNLSEREVKEYVNAELSDYKQLRGGVKFIDAIPRNNRGKIQRLELKKSNVNLAKTPE